MQGALIYRQNRPQGGPFYRYYEPGRPILQVELASYPGLSLCGRPGYERALPEGAYILRA